jgi:hypothetical protein
MKISWFQKILLCIAFFIAVYVIVQVFIMRNRRNNLYGLYGKEGFGNVGITNNVNDALTLKNSLIKGSANSCYDANGFIEIGDELNDKGLYHVLQKGCRFLDFEVYNIDGAAGIGYSGSSDFSSLETNTVPTLEALNKIMDCAFTSPCPNPTDPLFLQFRMKTVKSSIFEELADDINNTCGHKLIDTAIKQDTPISNLKGKVVIIVYSMKPSASVKGEADVDRTKLLDRITSRIPNALVVVSQDNNPDFQNEYSINDENKKSILKVMMPTINDMIDENSNILYSIEDNKAIEKSFEGLITANPPKINVVPYKYYIKDEQLELYEKKFKPSAFIDQYTPQSH